MLLSDYTELFDPCSIVIVAIAGFAFYWIWSCNMESLKHLCHHAYSNGYYYGSKGDHALPDDIRTRHVNLFSPGSYRDYHGEVAVRAWKLGNDHGKENRPRLSVNEIYKLAK